MVRWSCKEMALWQNLDSIEAPQTRDRLGGSGSKLCVCVTTCWLISPSERPNPSHCNARLCPSILAGPDSTHLRSSLIAWSESSLKLSRLLRDNDSIQATSTGNFCFCTRRRTSWTDNSTRMARHPPRQCASCESIDRYVSAIRDDY